MTANTFTPEWAGHILSESIRLAAGLPPMHVRRGSTATHEAPVFWAADSAQPPHVLKVGRQQRVCVGIAWVQAHLPADYAAYATSRVQGYTQGNITQYPVGTQQSTHTL